MRRLDAVSLIEYRYRAVCEVLAHSPIGEVAVRYGASRQSVHAWRRRFLSEGMPGLADRSRRPHTSPRRLDAEIEALICQLRQEHPRWGARRISHELGRRAVNPAPSRATVHRVLQRNGLVVNQEQRHKRKYRRWQRQAPMHLWQIDIMGGVPLADGREAKLVTGIDDHSRFMVIAAVVVIPNARAVGEAFTAAMRRYGVPFEVLTDNGGQFTGRHVKPQPVEVLFERICRDNGITQRLTKPRSPTTTGKIERFHKTLREELLHDVQPFASLTAAQEAIDGWIDAYNHHRPHQALDMATPASLFRPHGPTRVPGVDADQETAVSHAIEVIEPPTIPLHPGAVELDLLVPPGCQIAFVGGRHSFAVAKWLAGRTVRVWADLHHIHVTYDGQLLRSLVSRLRPEDLQWLTMRGAQPAGPPPTGAQRIPHQGGGLDGGQAVEIDRSVNKDGNVTIDKVKHLVGFAYAGRRITLRLDGHLMHAISDSALVGTWPCPIPADKLTSLQGARIATSHLPAPPLPAGSLRAQRRVHYDGKIVIAGQRLKIGPRHAGKLVTVIIEDTHFRILHGEEELAVKPRNDPTPITRLHVRGGWKKKPRQVGPDDKPSTKS